MRELTPGEDLAAALLGGSIGALYTSPCELLMIQQQNFNLGLAETFKKVLTEHGVTGGR